MSYYPTYYPQMNQQALQSQLNYLQNQQAQYQNMLSGMNQQQNVARQDISTQIVDSFESISANSVPMDNTGAIFVKRDGSEIQTRRWNPNGQIVTVSYLPVLSDGVENNAENEEKLKIGLSDEATTAFMSRFDDLANKIDLLEQSLSGKRQTRQKKEVED